MDQISTYVKDNTNIYSGASLGLILAGVLGSKYLGYDILKFFNNPIVQIVIMVLLLLVSFKNMGIALFGGLALMLILIKLNTFNSDKRIMDTLTYQDAEKMLDQNLVLNEIYDESNNLPNDLSSELSVGDFKSSYDS